MTGIRMVHPDLPGQPITVLDPVASVIYERSGWRLDSVADQLAWHPPEPALPEGYVTIVHPASGQSVNVPAESVGTLRASGWLLRSEHEANQGEAAARAASKQKAARPAAPKEE